MDSILDTIRSPEDLRALGAEKLELLAEEIRQEIVRVVSRSGGHLASSLGAVELAMALHYVFDTPGDKLIWDVGHQSYAHKILTGRRESFETLRQLNGISGFCKPSESIYDTYGAGHASTSLAAAFGMACARDLLKERYRIIAVIGDGAMTGGLAYEALNNIGHHNSDIIIILNDNEMSISPNVGAIARIFNRLVLGDTYKAAKQEIKEFVSRFRKLGPRMLHISHKLEETVKGLIVPGLFFEEMGIRYLGPIDGHNLDALLTLLRGVRMVRGPLIVHVITKKGKGYRPAEQNPEQFHSAPPFEVQTGQTKTEQATYTSVYGETLCEIAERDERVVAITAAMKEGTGLTRFAERFPERFFDVGIAEQCAVVAAAGMAMRGLRPFVTIYSTFLQRAYDAILHDVALQKLPVIFALDRGGIVGRDGPTHHGLFDFSYLRTIPNLVIMAPKDDAELRDMMHTALLYQDGPVALRYPRAAAQSTALPGTDFVRIPIGKAEVVREGDSGGAVILAIGNMVARALKAAEITASEGVSVGVVNMRFVKPLDEQLLRDVAARSSLIFSLEDNVVTGGMGSAINEAFALAGLPGACIPLAFPDKFIEHGTPDELYERYELTPEQIARRVLQAKLKPARAGGVESSGFKVQKHEVQKPG
jgi:1-deoxy-D-xylulose-5-phosphate synthase